MKKIVLATIVMMFLVGCGSSKTQAPTQTSTTVAKTPVPTTTNTILPEPSATPAPSSTASPIPSSTHTPFPSSTPDLAALVKAAQTPELFASYPSPDGMWRMDIHIYDCIPVVEGTEENAYEQLILVDSASGEQQVAAEQLQSCGGLGAYGFEGRFWSPNSRYFYYTDARQGFPDGCGYWQPPLSRFDTAFSQNVSLGRGSLSPDGSRLATLNSLPQTLVISDVDDGEVGRFQIFSGGETGPMVWSSDGMQLVYLQADTWCPLSGNSYLVLLDPATQQQTLLLESASPTFGSVVWGSSDELTLLDENGQEWKYNLSTQQLSLVP